jgi:formylglycine-generating enzyme required for sulfatase activity/uncharacterized caspase-like protein
MSKIALLVGVSEYEAGLTALPCAVRDMEALRQVLARPEIGGFDQVIALPNPDRQGMEEAIYTLFTNRQKDDLLLFYFSGHGVKDENGRLYLASRSTRKDQGELFKPSALAATVLHENMNGSRSQRQVIILDCCFSGAIAQGLTVRDDGTVDVKAQLGGKGRAILTSSTSTQYSFEQEGAELSIYTRYLVEGIATGAADQDEDGDISVDELYEYARGKVQEESPAMTPKFYPVEEGFRILLAKAPVGDPALKYRKEVENRAKQTRGKFSVFARRLLDSMQTELNLAPQQAAAIETEVLQPYREYDRKLNEYEQALTEAVCQEYPFSDQTQRDLEDYQRHLKLRDEDIAAISARILTPRQAEYERHLRETERQRQQQEAERKQQEAERRQQEEIQRQHEAERRQQQEAERLRQQQEAERQQEAEQRQQQQEAERLARQQRQQETERRQQREAERLAERRQRSQPSPTPPHPTPPASGRQFTRQQFLKWAGFGGGGLTLAWLARGILQTPSPNPPTPSPRPVTESELQAFRFDVVTVNNKGVISNRRSAQTRLFKEDLGDGVSLDMVFIPGGKFLMGSPATEPQRSSNEGPQRQVTIATCFIGRYTITQSQWRIVAALPRVNRDLEPDPANFKGANRPVEQVSWEEAVEFCDRLSRKTGRTYRLPSEAEWEYACRAGTTTPFHFGETITTDLANYNGNYTYSSEPKGTYRKQTTEVGSFPANGFGLYDMHGNVWEWCGDRWHENYNGAPSDGSVWETGDSKYRVLRGGSWNLDPRFCRSALRFRDTPDYRYDFIGFRVVSVSARTF